MTTKEKKKKRNKSFKLNDKLKDLLANLEYNLNSIKNIKQTFIHFDNLESLIDKIRTKNKDVLSSNESINNICNNISNTNKYEMEPEIQLPKVKLVSREFIKKCEEYDNKKQSNNSEGCFKRKLNYFTTMNHNDVDETDSNLMINYSNKRIKQDNTNLISEEFFLNDSFNPIKTKLDYYNDNLTNNTSNENNNININDEMSEKHLWFLSNEYDDPNEWKQLGIHLGLRNNDIQTIESKYLNRDGPIECFYQCLLKWRLQQPENCQFNYLCHILSHKMNKKFEFLIELKEHFNSFEENCIKAIITTKTQSKHSKCQKILNSYLDQLNQRRNNSLDQSKMRLKLTENDLWLASEYLFLEWKPISRCLSLNEFDLVSIESKYFQSDGLRECCYQALLQWSQIFYEYCTLEHLCLCLINLRLNLYAKQLLEKFLL